MKLTFHGGAGEVTGANYLLESEGEAILIDCGLMQGGHYAEKKNFESFPYDPKKIRAVFITHSHLDHIGRLPKLVKDGFTGPVYSTPPCRAFSQLLLADSEDILAREAARHKLAPLYNQTDIDKLMSLWQETEYHAEITAGPFRCRFYNAGHIMGSAFIVVEAEGKKVVFSGDLGSRPTYIIKPTEFIDSADYCVIESTYGNRLHSETRDVKDNLENIIEDTVKAGGVLLIPAFAMERTQQVLYDIHALIDQGRIPRLSVFLDSPLAISLGEAYVRYENYFNEDALRFLKGKHDLLEFHCLAKTRTTEESKKINAVPPPKIIIAGSGMSNGGRILHHERRYLSDPKSTLLLVGYQAKNTLGYQILNGAKTVNILGDEVPVNCRVLALTEYSAHADYLQLMEWLTPMRFGLKKVFVVQGEPEEAEPFAQRLRDELALAAHVPSAGESAVL